ncbi:MAG: B12-binding domain-containing radical SAM protein [Candidatus Omnitrophica bacterium]|nr:B12-binding domain-containing radical SAM protein [Candidatus Omnitrophota bacterium]
MDKILFIVPPHINFNQFINPAHNERIVRKRYGCFGSVLTEMPLGILSLSAYLKKHKAAETRLIDFNIVLNNLEGFEFSSFTKFFHDFLVSRAYLNYVPDIIGISALFTSSYRNVLDIAQCCRDIFLKAIIVAGGSVPTNMYEMMFKDSKCFDALCYGEGEKPLLGLAEAIDKARYLEESPSWITPRKLKGDRSFQYDFIEDLDEIPFYDYGICEAEEYWLNPAITAYASIEEKKKSFHVMTSRGCSFRCCFCSSHKVHGRKMRYHSIDRVREDFTRLKEQYGAKTIIFQDDHFMADKQRAFEIIDIIKELQMVAVFQNGLALYALDRKMLEAMKGAGVKQLLLSVESGSDRVLKEIMHKPLDLSIVKRVSSDCHELGIYTNVNILIGLPGETKQDIENTRAFLKTINGNWFLIFCANPLVGSEMYDICVNRNYLNDNFIGSDYKKAVVETEEFSAEYIQEMAYTLNLELNFAENSDFRLGNYEMALKGFENAIRAKNDHAFAYYYAAKCHEKLANLKKAQKYMDTAKRIVDEEPFWRKYFDMFNIPLMTHGNKTED